ncbi:N-acetylmuramidase [Streptococcus oricebi]|uniref:N-acetylmuramidase n=1 Tax=Streptococcus oricebi TaxID=1547447 RepID=A0ABS5B3Q9_9STRE|nr:GBS Bsp-like repeat-containing protein [Streptococcus oricebi]MBP2623467.1 N-acetylmuramidase [Streptococcus oricebi]
MKKHRLIYLASTAVLLGIGSYQVKADEFTEHPLESDLNREENQEEGLGLTKQEVSQEVKEQIQQDLADKEQVATQSDEENNTKAGLEQSPVKENQLRDKEETVLDSQIENQTEDNLTPKEKEKYDSQPLAPHDKTPEGHLSIENQDNNAGTYDVIVSQVYSPKGVKEVLLPTWSDKDGQDDLIWYTASQQANGNYKVTIKARNHKFSTGSYHSHLYYIQEDNTQIGIGSTSTQVSIGRPKGKIEVRNQDDQAGTFELLVTEISSPKGVKEVLLPTWSDKNGQDDLIWYKANQQADGSYLAKVSLRDHKFSTGVYHSHLYYIQENGSMVGVNSTSAEISLAPAQGKIEIQNQDNQLGTFDILITNISNPKGIREVLLPTWSKVNGQDDLVWYKASQQADGSYLAKVRARDHKYTSGEYSVHLYYVQEDGTTVGVGSTSLDVQIDKEHIKPTGNILIQNNNPKTGIFDVLITNISNPKGVKEVYIPVWSTIKGQDDLVWYQANRQNDGSYKITVKASDHKNSVGEYQLHLYYVQDDGSKVGVGSTTVQVSKATYTTPYFSQRDGRWAGRVYGIGNMDAAGCVPTTLAMVISGIRGETVLPTTVADYLYHQTNTFNKFGFGTSSRGIVLAANNWGLTTEVLGTDMAIRDALESGHHVLGAVGTSIFASYPITHELVLKGYDNGKTYVMDPYNSRNNGWYSLSYLSSVRSTDPTDNTEGSPFIAIKG